MYKQGAYQNATRRNKEENYKERLYRRLKKQWLNNYKPYDVNEEWSKKYYPEDYGSDGEYMSRDSAHVERLCREHVNKDHFGYVNYGYSDLYKPAVEKMLQRDFEQQVDEYNNPEDTCPGCGQPWYVNCDSYCWDCFFWEKEENERTLAYQFLAAVEEESFAGHDDWYEYDVDCDYEYGYELVQFRREAISHYWDLYREQTIPKLWYKGQCPHPADGWVLLNFSYQTSDDEEWDVWDGLYVFQVHPDCDYSIQEKSNLVEDEDYLPPSLWKEVYDTDLKQGYERNQSRRIKEENFKKRLDKRFVEQIRWNSWQGGRFEVDPDMVNSNGEFLGVGSKERERLTREFAQRRNLRSWWEHGYSDIREFKREQLAKRDLAKELFVTDVEEIDCSKTKMFSGKPITNLDYMLGCDGLDIEWILKTYGFNLVKE